MVNLNLNGKQPLNLTQEEQTTLLQYCSDLIDDNILQMLFSATNGFLILTKEQCEKLRSTINIKMNQISNYSAIDILGKISNKLSPSPITQQLARELETNKYDTLDQLQSFTDHVMNTHNNKPDPNLGNLSPKQIHALICSEWDQPNCPIKFCDNLTFEDVAESPIYHNTLILLNELSSQKNTATAKGNLTRKIVNACLQSFKIDNDIVNSVIKTSKTLNESDIPAIWITRLIAEIAGLIKKQKTKFIITKKGNKLLNKENAGKIYHLLVLAYFRKLNIGFYDRLPDLDEMQSTIAFSLYQTDRLAKNKVKIEKITQKLVLPSILKGINSQVSELILADWIIRARIIEPFEYAGLLLCKREKLRYFNEITNLQQSPLFKKFIQFEF